MEETLHRRRQMSTRIQTIGKAAISDRFSRKAFQTGKQDHFTLPSASGADQLLESVVEQYATPRLLKKDYLCDCKIPMLLPYSTLNGQPEALNIIDNAIKYTEHSINTISAKLCDVCKGRLCGCRFRHTGNQASECCSFYRSKGGSGQEGSQSRSHIPCPTDHIRRGGYIKIASVPGKGNYIFIFHRNNNNSIKTIRFHFPLERMWEDSYAIIYISKRSFPFPYRFFAGSTHLWICVSEKIYSCNMQFMRWMELIVKCKRRPLLQLSGTSGSKQDHAAAHAGRAGSPYKWHSHGGRTGYFSLRKA